MSKNNEPIIPGVSNEELLAIIEEYENEQYTQTPTYKLEYAFKIQELLQSIASPEDKIEIRYAHKNAFVEASLEYALVVPPRKMNILRQIMNLADSCTIETDGELGFEKALIRVGVYDAFTVTLIGNVAGNNI